MADTPESGSKKLTREERLAAKLRENLRRRKSQAREMDGTSSSENGGNGAETP